jgi:hypothetical protein
MVIRRYLSQANAIDHTSGNVLKTVDFGTGIDGGWRLRKVPREAKYGLLFFAAISLGGWLLKKKVT